MKKIISLFQRNYDGERLVRNEVVPGAEWVLAGEGVATRKLNGTACFIRGNRLFKRYDAKKGKFSPPGFEPTQEPDPVTGHWPGWVPVGDGPEDQWFREGFKDRRWDMSGAPVPHVPEWTGELIGPRVQGNPEGVDHHMIVRHGGDPLPDAPRDFEMIKRYLSGQLIEGIVWHHPDGRMVKIKRKDFFKRTF